MPLNKNKIHSFSSDPERLNAVGENRRFSVRANKRTEELK